MVLSRIWSAFIIIAFMVAGFKMLQGDEQIFTRMVTGKSSDKYDSVFYYGTGNPTTMALSTNLQKATLVLTDAATADSASILKSSNPILKIDTYVSIQKKLVRKVDGIIETAKNAVIDIIIPLIGVLTLFMGFLSIAEKAGGVRLLSKIIWPFFSRIFPDIPKGHPAFGHMMMTLIMQPHPLA
jgi:hypothetical protein